MMGRGIALSRLITEEMVINEVIRKYPSTIPIFNRYNVDACCGGGFSIKKTAGEGGVELEPLLEALNKAALGKN